MPWAPQGLNYSSKIDNLTKISHFRAKKGHFETKYLIFLTKIDLLKDISLALQNNIGTALSIRTPIK